MINGHAQDHRDHGFLLGLITGGVVGAALAVFVAPRLASELKRATDSAKTLGRATAERYQEVSTRVADTVDDMAAQGRGFRDDVHTAITREPKDGARHAGPNSGS